LLKINFQINLGIWRGYLRCSHLILTSEHQKKITDFGFVHQWIITKRIWTYSSMLSTQCTWAESPGRETRLFTCWIKWLIFTSTLFQDSNIGICVLLKH
jgi:hypothetical protein